VSGQTSVNPRSNLIRAMVALSRRVIAMSDTLTYTGKIDNLPPQIEKPLANLVQESTARMVMLVPLFPSERLVRRESDEGPQKKNKKPKKAFGCLIVENMSESQPSALLQERIEILSEHVAASLWNSRRHNRIFLRPLWTTIGRAIEWFHGRKIAIAAAVVAAIAAVILAMVFVPWDYRVEAEGKLMPVVQQAVFSPWEGRIQPPKIRGGDHVEAGQILLEMDNERLEREKLAIENDRQLKVQQLDGLEGLIQAARQSESEDPSRPKESYKLQAQLMQLVVEVEGLTKQEENIQAQLDKLIITAPISGIIPDLKIEQELMNRPVQAGQLLFQIMDDRIESGWQLELRVEGKRIGHIARAMKKLRDEGKDPALKVEFIPATTYDKTFTGTITSISATALADQELGSVYEVIVKPDNVAAIPNLAIRTEVSAKINCGKRSLGYVMFGDVVEFCQKFFWF
jgi:multidrug efflux pump subunit AcrA (membrane-fusion protein)